jgi:histidinol phosphatase-like enzyme
MNLLFDLDDTLVEVFTSRLLPGVRDWWLANAQSGEHQILGICSNQGGVGLRHWMEQGQFGEPTKYPTEESLRTRMVAVWMLLDCTYHPPPVYFAYRYRSKKGIWGPVPEGRENDPAWAMNWRKPAPGMLLEACRQANVDLQTVWYIGNDIEDERTAAAAGCLYQNARAFFEGVSHAP